jgi:biopolymer transport protein ExbD
MGAKVGGGGKSGMDEINVTPLIDIVLVLLIIFMVLTPMTMRKMQSQLPPLDPPEEPPPDQVPDQMIVGIYADGTLSLNLQSLDDKGLHEAVKKRSRGSKKTVFVDAHPDAKYARVIEVMDTIRDAGTDKISFVELKDEGPVPPLAAGEVPVVAGAVVPPAP